MEGLQREGSNCQEREIRFEEKNRSYGDIRILRKEEINSLQENLVQ